MKKRLQHRFLTFHKILNLILINLLLIKYLKNYIFKKLTIISLVVMCHLNSVICNLYYITPVLLPFVMFGIHRIPGSADLRAWQKLVWSAQPCALIFPQCFTFINTLILKSWVVQLLFHHL